MKWLDQMEHVSLSKNGKTRAIMGLRAINKNKNAIGMSRKVYRKKMHVSWCIRLERNRYRVDSIGYFYESSKHGYFSEEWTSSDHERKKMNEL